MFFSNCSNCKTGEKMGKVPHTVVTRKYFYKGQGQRPPLGISMASEIPGLWLKHCLVMFVICKLQYYAALLQKHRGWLLIKKKNLKKAILNENKWTEYWWGSCKYKNTETFLESF